MPNNTINNRPRNNSVFKSEFSDGSVFYSAKVRAPDSPDVSLAWAIDRKKNGNPGGYSRLLVASTITHKGESHNSVVCSELSKEESQLIKCHLIRKARELNLTVLNLMEETLIEMTERSFPYIQKYCQCGFNRANYLVDLANKLP
jgi:hypothetical protein